MKPLMQGNFGIQKMYDDGDHGDKFSTMVYTPVQIVVNEANPLNRYYKVTAAFWYSQSLFKWDSNYEGIPLLPDEIVDQSFLAVETIQNNFYANVSRLGLTGARAEALAEALADLNIGPGNAKLLGAYLSIYYVYIDPVSGYKY